MSIVKYEFTCGDIRYIHIGGGWYVGDDLNCGTGYAKEDELTLVPAVSIKEAIVKKIGDTIKANCETCQSFQEAVFKLRDITLSGRTIKDVLVGVCSNCDSTIVLPHNIIK